VLLRPFAVDVTAIVGDGCNLSRTGPPQPLSSGRPSLSWDRTQRHSFALNPGVVCCGPKELVLLSCKSRSMHCKPPAMHSTFEPAGVTQHVGIQMPWTRAVLSFCECERIDCVDHVQCLRREN